ncbi:hypothetical protein PRIPAC_88543 [Pristionchus pacificus]|uniref:Uncharacterized protein n=1 Tax=Pristionchus pacificus TaxID=54126 RepID=A0A2A6B3Q2_PRIPA|nr:hypothetical protein PRIPAC_88543 [Pristionchus pacificus]|eukprot:PDM60515.1 hypothetical protein PRIPAC_53493 [Pristionchus pacificus]
MIQVGDTRRVAQADGRGFSKLGMEESGSESRPPVASARMENVEWRIRMENSSIINLNINLCECKYFNIGSMSFKLHFLHISSALFIIALMPYVTVVVTSYYTDVLFQPTPLFPNFAGYCTGLLCNAGVPLPLALAEMLFTFNWLMHSVYMCSIFCHQTLAPQR